MSRLSVSKCTKCYFIKPLSANAAHQLIKFTFSAKGNTTRLCILRGFLLILKQGINFFPTAGYRVDSAAPTVQADSTMDTQLRAPFVGVIPSAETPPVDDRERGQYSGHVQLDRWRMLAGLMLRCTRFSRLHPIFLAVVHQFSRMSG